MEYLDLCDEEGRPTGETVSREEAHRTGARHRTAHVWLVRKGPEGPQVLLQKRSMRKESYPGMYDTSSAGHIPAGEEPLPSALRELREELGIRAEPQELAYAGRFSVRYEKEFHGRLFRDNEVTFVYVYRGRAEEGTMVLQKSEVEQVRWFGLDGVCRRVREGKGPFCVTEAGLKVLCDYLEREKPNAV